MCVCVCVCLIRRGQLTPQKTSQNRILIMYSSPSLRHGHRVIEFTLPDVPHFLTISMTYFLARAYIHLARRS